MKTMTTNRKSVKAVFSGIMASLILAGCASVGPDYQTPDLQLGDYAQTPVTAANNTDQQVNQQWWQQFGDEQLSLLIQVADRHNPSVAVAQANLDRALAIFDDVQDNDLPLGSAEGRYHAQGQILPGDPSPDPSRVNLHSRQIGLSIGWEIDVVGKFARAEEAANADAEAAWFTWQEARLSLLGNVANTYVQYRGLQSRLQVAQETLASLSRTQEIVQAQVDAGFATRLDVLRVQAQVAAVEADVPALSAQTEAARQILIAMAGGEHNLMTMDWAPKDVPVLSSPVALEESSDFLQKRPDVMAAERQLASATAAIGVAHGDLYPSLSVTGFLGFLSTGGGVLSGDARAWSITPGINWQALDLDSVYARVRAADAQQAANLAQFEQTVLQAISETRTAISNYTQLQYRLHSLDAQVAASEEALELARYQYKNGAIDLLNLLDVERAWLSSRDQRVDAQAQMTGSLIDIYTAMGGGILIDS